MPPGLPLSWAIVSFGSWEKVPRQRTASDGGWKSSTDSSLALGATRKATSKEAKASFCLEFPTSSSLILILLHGHTGSYWRTPDMER